MTRWLHPARATRARTLSAPTGKATLRLPDDWDDGSSFAIGKRDSLQRDDEDIASESEDLGDEGFASRTLLAYQSSPPKLEKAMVALDNATNEAGIAAARANLRLSTF